MSKTNLTQGSVVGNIFSFSLPYMLSYFLQILYGLADLFVIGRYCGVDSTTAVSIGAQVMHMLTVVIIGLAMGTTVLTARAVGAGDRGRASKIIGNTFSIFAILAVVLTALLLASCHFIVHLMDTPPEAVRETQEYLTVCFAGVPFVVFYNVIASVYRGLGDSKSPMYFVIVACVTNIVLDYLLIGWIGLGAMGAALGTTLSQVVSVLFAAMAIRRHRSVLGIRRSDLRPSRRMLGAMMKIGLPVGVQDGLIQVSFIAITVIANGRGLYDAAAVGIVEKFIGLLFVIPSSMLSTVSAVSAQNIGAGQMDRARATMRYAIYICAGFGLVVATVLQFVPEVAVRIFTDDTQVVAKGAEYLQGYVWDCVLAGIHFCFSGFFTACGYSIISFAHNLLAIVSLRIPLSYLASEAYPDTLYPMGLATVAGSLLSVIICAVVYKWLLKHEKLETVC